MRAPGLAALLAVLFFGGLHGSDAGLGTLTGGARTHLVEPGETLTAIGARYGVDWRTLARDNGLDAPDRLHPGQVLLVDNRHVAPAPPFDDGIVINVPQRMLFHFADGELVRAYPVALGRPDWRTPVRDFRVSSRDVNPVWVVPPSIQEEMRRAGRPVIQEAPPGPENPLGAFRLRLDDPSYSIHGTNAPNSIYTFQSHGCIRMQPDDIADLFHRVAVGASVRIIYEPVLMGASPAGEVFLEVHPDVYGMAETTPSRAAARLIEAHGVRVDPEAVEAIVGEAAGVARALPRAEAP